MTARLPGPKRVAAFDLDLPTSYPGASAAGERTLLVVWRSAVPVGTLELSDSELADRDAVVAAARALERRAAAAPPAVTGRALPTISVVVPTVVARTADLQLLLDGLGELEYPDHEVILVDNRRTIPEVDPLPAIIAGRTRVRVVRQPVPGISAARNAGCAAARGEIIAFTDDDVRVDRNWLRAIGRRFVTEPDLQAVTGLILPAELETPAQIWFEDYYGGFSGERTFSPATVRPVPARRLLRGARVEAEVRGVPERRRFAVYGIGAFGAGANMAFRKSAVKAIGGFDEALGTGTTSRGGEDLAALISLAWRGHPFGYEPAAVVHHRHRREYDELLHQMRGNGIGFTAMLMSLVLHDPRHLVGVGAQLPLAGARVTAAVVRRLTAVRSSAPVGSAPVGSAPSPSTDGPPRRMMVSELGSYPLGPGAYLRSRRARAIARRRAAAGQPDPREGVETRR